MSVILFDPDAWLVSLHRALADYIKDNIGSRPVIVEMGAPSPDQFNKESPPELTIIHFEQDDKDSPIMGFGIPGEEEYDEVAGTWMLHEAQPHLVNFDVGVWCSTQAGGSTARMEVVQKLTDLFTMPAQKKTMSEVTGGIWPLSFAGGRFALDRINDLPVWRAMDMTLIVRVVGRFTPEIPEVVPSEGFDQTPNLTIVTDDGSQLPVT